MIVHFDYITLRQTAVERDNSLPPGHSQEYIAQT